MLCEHHIRNTLSQEFAKIIYLLADLFVERIKFQSASANLSRNYNAATMSKSLVFHCQMIERNETSERIVASNQIVIQHVFLVVNSFLQLDFQVIIAMIHSLTCQICVLSVLKSHFKRSSSSETRGISTL